MDYRSNRRTSDGYDVYHAELGRRTSLASAIASGLVLGAILWVASASAGSLQVKPTGFTLSAQHSVRTLWITNASDHPTVVQLRAMAWSQQDGQDVYTPTSDLLVTPPIFKIEPGTVLTVRAGLRRPLTGSVERSYRLIVQEVPTPNAAQISTLQIALRIILPVFVTPVQDVAPSLHWQARSASSDGLSIQLHNSGTSHVQLHELYLLTSDRLRTAVPLTGATYILQGQSRQWQLTPGEINAPAGTSLKVVARTEQGEFNASLQVKAR